jgi:flagellar basal-body rod protein FlgG
MTVPQNSSQMTINAQGQLTVIVPGSTTPTLVGQIGLTRFINKAGLNPIGDNLFTDTPASGTPQDGVANTDGFGDMQQGNLEQANVEVVTEISDLIAAQRAYEMNAKVVSAADQMLQSTSNMFR